MILFELVGTENNPTYQALQVSNGSRQYDFLLSIVTASLDVGRPFLSSYVIKALNHHAIACLHTNAGEYRPCPVRVGTEQPDGSVRVEYQPPDSYRVQALMDDMINVVNRSWEASDPFGLAAFVLWKLNAIHPFIQGNGRTARAAAYFVLCLKHRGLLPGKVILPELIKQNRDAYVAALRVADQSGDLGPLAALLAHLMQIQISTAERPEGSVQPDATPEQIVVPTGGNDGSAPPPENAVDPSPAT